MIYEIASLTIDPAHATEFEAAVVKARPHFERAEGFVSFSLQRVLEEPSCYRLVVGWDSVEAHMVTFRASPGFQEWRALSSPFFTQPPSVLHTEILIW